MIGILWTREVTLTPCAGRWVASAVFRDEGFGQPGSVEGEFGTRHSVRTITEAVDILLADLTRLGIRLGTGNVPPALLIEGDGEAPGIDYPAGWRGLLVEQAQRIGWETYDWHPARKDMTS